MKTIDTLVDDILEILENGVDEDTFDKYAKDFDNIMSKQMKRQLVKKDRTPSLRMSNIGSPCGRKLYLQYHYADDDKREPMRGPTIFKFMYGDLTEEMILLLAKISGHTVTGTQSEQEINGIKGHRDCIIDGRLVDVKSASAYSFKKFKDNALLEEDNDPFGYYVQLMSYLYAGQDDDEVIDKDQASFLVFDKQSGAICLDTYGKPTWFDNIPEMYDRRKKMVDSEEWPDREYQPVEDGKSGNMKLPMFCSYCDMKHVCYDNIRTFISSRGPVHLTTVAREPRMLEINPHTGEKIEKEEKEPAT